MNPTMTKETLEAGREITPSMTKEEIYAHMTKYNVRFLRMQFTDITGNNKNVEVPASQFESALDGQVLFDGSSIEGFTRIEESDMVLKPDFSTYHLDPWPSFGQQHTDHGKVAHIICDVYTPDGSPFEGCPRLALKRMCEEAAALGYTMKCGPEAEFFLFSRTADGAATTVTHDSAGYFDLAPTDLGEECRREIVIALEALGFEIEAAHHEVAPGQHEIDFKYDDAVSTGVTHERKICSGQFARERDKQPGGVHVCCPRSECTRSDEGAKAWPVLVYRVEQETVRTGASRQCHERIW